MMNYLVTVFSENYQGKEGHGYTTYINDVHLKEMMFFQAE